MNSPFTSNATISTLQRRHDHIMIVTVMPDAPFAHLAGQYVRIELPGQTPRAFSLATPPRADGALTFHIRNTGQGISAALFALDAGARIFVDMPSGIMDTKHSISRPVLMVAGGTGIAPMLAMAQEILQKGLTEEGITLVYGIRTREDIYCQPELDALLSTGEVTLILAIGDETPDQILAGHAHDFEYHAVYIAGAQAMVDKVMTVLHIKRADMTRVFTDSEIRKIQ